MKRLAIAMLVMCAVCGMAQAQVHIGAKVGLNMTNFIGNNSPHDVAVNYQVGGFIELGLLGPLSISPEVVFSTQGGKHTVNGYSTGDVINQKTKFSWNTNYVNIPVMLKLKLIGGLSLDAGPQFGFNVSSKCKTQSDNYEGNVNDYGDYTKKFDFALGIGATYNINRFLFVQGRYTMSVSKTYKTDIMGINLPVDSRNGVIQLAVGLKL
ncbi:MAG: porin family protein [Muribaculaceae bacterium]